MEKKSYLRPQLRIINTSQQTLLASSGSGGGSDSGGGPSSLSLFSINAPGSGDSSILGYGGGGSGVAMGNTNGFMDFQ